MTESGAQSLADSQADLPTLLYDRLRELAASRMRGERAGHTLQPTALVHEVYIRLAPRTFTERTEFLCAAARAMRQVLVDHARARNTAKRGGGWSRRDLATLILVDGDSVLDAVALDEALTKLERLNPRHAAIVELRFYAGLTCEEIAQALACSLSTVEKEWRVARAWLHAELAAEPQ